MNRGSLMRPTAQIAGLACLAFVVAGSTDGRHGAPITSPPGGQYLANAGYTVNHTGVLAAGRSSPSPSYNSVDDEYMVVWADGRNGGGADIFGQRVNADGSSAGGNFPIWEFEASQSEPVIAFNPSDNQYLVVWKTQETGYFSWARGRRVAADGTPLLTADFPIMSEGHSLSIAHNAFSLDYLVTGRLSEVSGQRVSRLGALIGSQIDITTGSGAGPLPGDVAYDRWNARYLVAWRNLDTGSEGLEGQLVAGYGALHGGVIRISNDNPGTSQIAFDPVNRRYLVVFEEFTGANTVKGQFVGTDGALIGGNFEILGSGTASTPDLTYSASSRSYVLVWLDYSEKILAKAIAADGKVAHQALEIRTGSTNSIRPGPKIAHNSRRDEFLVAWAERRGSSTQNVDIHSRVISFSRIRPFVASLDGGDQTQASKPAGSGAVRPHSDGHWAGKTGGG